MVDSSEEKQILSYNKPLGGLEIRDCGLVAYGEALALQEELCLKRQNDQICNTVLIVEHPAVITMGARKSENKLLVTENVLADLGIELVQVGRGGGTTAHNPGQVVFYPIIKLKSLKLGVNEYIRRLEATGMELLESFGLTTECRKGLPGLWIGEKKIASIGVRLKRWVTFHGMAININNDLGIFDTIIPCGLTDVEITSVEKETGKKTDMKEVKSRLAELCKKNFTVEVKDET